MSWIEVTKADAWWGHCEKCFWNGPWRWREDYARADIDAHLLEKHGIKKDDPR